MRLTESINNINMALNYPALAYEDISIYFDMAIAELNTTLHTCIPTVSEMVKEFRRLASKPLPNQVVLDVDESTPVPSEITSTTIKFPAFTVLFADNAFYGKKISDYTKIDVPETTMTLQEGVNGAVYVYVNTSVFLT